MNNIKINYLYRDYSNYKQYGTQVYSNHTNLDVEQIKDVVAAHLLDGEYFVAELWSLPNLFFKDRNEDDHEWHEFVSVECTEDKTTTIDIVTLLDTIKAAGQYSASGARKSKRI